MDYRDGKCVEERIKGGVMGGRDEFFLTQIFGDLYIRS